MLKVDGKNIFIIEGTCILLMLLSVIIYLGQEAILDIKLDKLCLYVAILSMLALAYFFITAKNGLLAPSCIYVTVYVIFHLSLVGIVGFGFEMSSEYQMYFNEWIKPFYFKKSILLALIGLVGYIIGHHSVRIFRKETELNSEYDANISRSNLLLKLGFTFILFGFLAWLALLISRGGFGIFGGSYENYIYKTASPFREWIYFFLGLGLLFVAVSPKTLIRKAGIGIFVLFSILALPLGLRGEVLFPVFSTLAAMGLKSKPVSSKTMLTLGILLLCLISAVKQVRKSGISSTSFSEVALTPTDALAEMGSSIRPVMEVVSWVENGEEHIWGSSYWAPFDRLLVYFVPGWTRPNASEDDRLLGQYIGRRVGSVGFSVVAEAFWNFGTIGVFFILFLIGVIFGKLDTLKPSLCNQLIVGAISMTLLLNVRNSFIFVPAGIALDLLIISSLIFFTKRHNGSSKTQNMEGQLSWK